ncbi:hypothetical protein Tco_1186795 [Tanacetum coccineum]
MNSLNFIVDVLHVLISGAKEEALPKASPATATVAVRNAYTHRVAEQQEVACLILLSMTLEIQKNLEDRTAFEILQELKTMFQQQAELRNLFEMLRACHAVRCKQGEKGIPKKALVILVVRQGQIQKPKPQAQCKGKNKGKAKSKLAYDPKHKILPSSKKEHPDTGQL